MIDFTEEQIERYARHIILPEVGAEGQSRLLESKVFMIGAGGLGSPVAYYLAAAGVGTIGIADADVVDMSNLQRQIIHNQDRVGMPKVESACETIQALNPDVTVRTYNEYITADNVREIVREYDLIIDGCDNFPTRFLVNDACYFEKKPLVSGAMFRFEGQVATFKPHQAKDAPCYRCLYPEPPPAGLVPSCSEAGILGALAGAVGTIQAVEAIKELLGIGDSLAGYLMTFDALRMEWKKLRLRKDPACPLCGPNPTITDLVTYEQACELKRGE
ncbi:MAG: molybdopterin-synthase adenylyltransferase MoeB [Zetaproteobacteria bacterium]|nr:MAG: molybdopterin-synthase adenylyltransferase MoeB [Zetaproteobacteria bacterium]